MLGGAREIQPVAGRRRQHRRANPSFCEGQQRVEQHQPRGGNVMTSATAELWTT